MDSGRIGPHEHELFSTVWHNGVGRNVQLNRIKDDFDMSGIVVSVFREWTLECVGYTLFSLGIC